MTDKKENQPRFRAPKLRRLRAIEELYLNGYCAQEIYTLLKTSYPVTYGTIRNDIVDLRKIWKMDTSNRDMLEGKDRYLASLRAIRRKVMDGWQEPVFGGGTKVVGRDFKQAHRLDKEIARLSGVTLASDMHSIHLSIQAAKDYVKTVMDVVMKHVEDPDIQRAIVEDLEAIGNDTEPST